jgi:hypothetical protein
MASAVVPSQPIERGCSNAFAGAAEWEIVAELTWAAIDGSETPGDHSNEGGPRKRFCGSSEGCG